jgi:hypothetical protein
VYKFINVEKCTWRRGAYTRCRRLLKSCRDGDRAGVYVRVDREMEVKGREKKGSDEIQKKEKGDELPECGSSLPYILSRPPFALIQATNGHTHNKNRPAGQGTRMTPGAGRAGRIPAACDHVSWMPGGPIRETRPPPSPSQPPLPSAAVIVLSGSVLFRFF